MIWTTWYFDPLPLAAAAVALMLFASGFLRLRRRAGARYADGWRVPLFVLALALATLPVISPLDQAGDEYLLSAHMLQHVLLGDAAPALALVALRGPLLFFVLPASVMRVLGHQRLLRRTLAFLLRPSVSLAVWALVIGAWHIPAAYDYALGHQAVHYVEHLSFLTVGLLVWAQLVTPAHRHRLRPSQRLGCMIAMLAFALALGGILVATPPLYPAYAEQSVRLFGISPALDQRLAGLLMIGEQVASLALCFAFLLPALRQEAARKPLTTESQVLPVYLTTKDGALMEPRGRNRWQSVAKRTGRKPA
jgi:cytochrome c oxidase assembly factor CtaG